MTHLQRIRLVLHPEARDIIYLTVFLASMLVGILSVNVYEDRQADRAQAVNLAHARKVAP